LWRTRSCDGILHDQGDTVAAAEIIMVWKYCDAIFIFWPRRDWYVLYGCQM
jgi:hypothetical protein